MATFTATAAQSTAPAFFNVNGDVTRIISRAVGGTAISAGDVWQMVKIPAGALITDLMVNISSTVQSYTTNIGDGLSAGRYFASQSMVLTQTVRLGDVGTVAIAGLGYSYSAEDTIDITWTTVTSGTAADANVTLLVRYTNMNQT